MCLLPDEYEARRTEFTAEEPAPEDTIVGVDIETVSTARVAKADARDEPVASLDDAEGLQPAVIESGDEGCTVQEEAANGDSFHLSMSETPRHLKSVL